MGKSSKISGLSGKIHKLGQRVRVCLPQRKSYKRSTEQLHSQINGHRKYEQELQFIDRILKISVRKTDKPSFLNKLTAEVKEFTDCQAVGIRILDNKAFIPYESHTGFSPEFYESESFLSIETDKCMCINVIRGDTDPEMEFYSEFGSFYMNATTKFLATVSEEDKGQTRNRCNEEGYESVALVPIRNREAIIGLIHIADKHEQMVPLELVQLLEKAGMSIGPVIQRILDEDLLKEQEQKYRIVADFTYDWEYWVDPEGNFVYVSPSCQRITGYSLEEFMKNPDLLLDIIHPDDRNLWISHRRKIPEKSEACSLEFRIIDRCGNEHWISHCCQAVYSDEKYMGRRGSNRDITKRKQAEAEREELLKTVSAKNAELQSIVYIASHDLRSPLVNIEGFGGELSMFCHELRTLLLNTNPDTDEKTKIQNLLKEDIPESLKFITAGTKKIKMLLDGLLQVSRVGVAKINILPLDMNKLLDDIRHAMEFQFSDTGTEVVIDDLPGCLADEAMTNQIFSNLIDNAIKYIDPNRPGKIHISGWTDGSMTTYCVEDNGMGLARDHIEKIFEIFYRLKPDDSVGGEGLGLSIVMRILDRLNGHIHVESQPGKGSKFFVSLPMAKS